MGKNVKNWLNNEGYSKFQEAKRLATEQSKLDPETQPYASKYKSRDILKILKNKLHSENEFESCCDDAILNDERIVGSKEYLMLVLNYELGINFIECEEVSTGEEYLVNCITGIMNFSKSMCSTLLISLYNQLGLLWSNRSSHDKAFEYLNLAESIYVEAKKSGNSSPIDFHDVWRPSNERTTILERSAFFEGIHTLTLFYLAQVLGHLGKQSESARYCHTTLQRQMDTKQYDPLDWSLCCATLGQYYVTQDQYTMSKYCLACSEIINKEAFERFNSTEFSDATEKERYHERICKSKADVQRCWAKYALNLLRVSHENKLQLMGNPTEPIIINVKNNNFKELKYGDLEVSQYEDQVSDKLANNYLEAKKLFTFGIQCLNNSKDFYKLDGYVSDYVEVTQDISQFYKLLAFFYNDFEDRCKMHKRRIDMLANILIELNPQHYLQICRQLSFEIAESYSEMVELKKKILEENPSKLSVSAVRKINNLISKSVSFYTGFVDTYKKDGKLPNTFEDDDIRGILLCFFCMARLHSKYLTNDQNVKFEHMKEEKGCYEFIVGYCDSHQDMPKVFEEELAVSREMHALFQAKMENVMRNYNNANVSV